MVFGVCEGRGFVLAFPIKFLIDEVDEKIDIYLSTSKDFHDGHAFILHLK